MRPDHLSDDHIPTALILLHAIEGLEATDEEVRKAWCIYPTVPLLAS